MDMKRIGAFLRTLRKEKGLTQEQLAEILLVSGRSISRWETGTNMPDLSILIQMAEFYGVDVKEILNGEREGGTMDKELKETLSKVADYSKLEKEKAAKVGSTAFVWTFGVCAAMIVLQLVVTGKWAVVLGETVTLLLGGIIYIGMMVYHGIWEKIPDSSVMKSGITRDALTGFVCAGVFAAALAFTYMRLGASWVLAARAAVAFFIGIWLVGFAVLRLLAYFSRKRKEKRERINAGRELSETEKASPICIFTAEDRLQAEMIVETLAQNGIMAYKQAVGDADFAAARYGMGKGVDDRVAVWVAEEKEAAAMEVVKGMGV